MGLFVVGDLIFPSLTVGPNLFTFDLFLSKILSLLRMLHGEDFNSFTVKLIDRLTLPPIYYVCWRLGHSVIGEKERAAAS
jgi:uncharacterized protein (DUF2062 family)